MAARKLEDLLVKELRDLYRAQKQMTKALPAMEALVRRGRWPGGPGQAVAWPWMV